MSFPWIKNKLFFVLHIPDSWRLGIGERTECFSVLTSLLPPFCHISPYRSHGESVLHAINHNPAVHSAAWYGTERCVAYAKESQRNTFVGTDQWKCPEERGFGELRWQQRKEKILKILEVDKGHQGQSNHQTTTPLPKPCQGPASAWRGILEGGLFGSSKETTRCQTWVQTDISVFCSSWLSRSLCG